MSPAAGGHLILIGSLGVDYVRGVPAVASIDSLGFVPLGSALDAARSHSGASRIRQRHADFPILHSVSYVKNWIERKL